MDLILASTSAYRRDLLSRLRLPFRTVAPGVDEAAIQGSGAVPQAIALQLASSKAEAVLAREPAATVIGSDQVVSLDGKILGKPGTADRAIDQLLSVAGRTHDLITAVVLADRDGAESHIDVSRVTVRALSRDEAERYVDADLPLDCAGSYKIESLGIALIDRVVSEDQTAIVGLPLIGLCRLLRARGVKLP